jgi:hypothetical protein
LNKSNTFNLIKGTFSIEQAKDLLTDLYSSKLKYHTLCAWKHEERYATKSDYHTARINQLKMERDQVIQFLENLNVGGQLTIESSIQISFQENNSKKWT